MTKIFKRLVLSGGSVKGLAYVGALKYFEENKDTFGSIREFVGTSIGSLASLLIILNYTSSQLKKLFWDLEFSNLQSLSMSSFLETFGLDDGKLVEKFIKDCISSKGLSPEISFSQLQNITGKSLVACGTNVDKQEFRFFDSVRTPHMPVFLALRISMAIPILFQPILFEGNHYVDGGITNDIPVNYPCEDNSTTLCLNLEEENRGASGCQNYFYNLLKTSFRIINESSEKFAEVNGITFVKVCSDIRISMDFSLTLEQKEYLYQVGYDSVNTAFK
jgi:predicted acylesterase/phospholipase RssA